MTRYTKELRAALKSGQYERIARCAAIDHQIRGKHAYAVDTIRGKKLIHARGFVEMQFIFCLTMWAGCVGLLVWLLIGGK